jgi:ADP-ribosylglycohydrolase
VELLRQGADPYTAGARGDTNGCAMRVSVVGLINAGDRAGAIREAMISATPTHSTDAAYSGACAVAAAVAQACVTDSVDAVIEAGIAGAIEGRKHGHPWLAASLPRRIEMAVTMARLPTTPHARMREIYDVIGTGLLITESVPAAFAVFAMADGDPMQAAMYAAALSGDADTIGAIACAMAGALRGIDAIPAAHQETLRTVNPTYDFERTARGLWAIQQARHPER